jgi:hypothetical protein
MFQVGHMTQRTKAVGDELLPYRRLVELQKQMIEMAHQHEKSKRACHGLREQMALSFIARQRARQSPLDRLRLFACRLFPRRSAIVLSTAQFNPFRSTPSSSC